MNFKSVTFATLLATVLIVAAQFALVSARDRTIHNLAFSGGGNFVPAHVGFLSVVEQSPGYDVKRVVGVSIGGLFGTLVAAGFNSTELLILVAPVNSSAYDPLTVGTNFISGFGMTNGLAIRPVIIEAVYLKTGLIDPTFWQLFQATGVELTLGAFNLNQEEMVWFNYENTPNVTVSSAVEFSASFPILYTPGQYNGELYLDGGIGDYYPIDFFEDDLMHSIGSNIVSQTPSGPIPNIQSFTSDLFNVLYKKYQPDLSQSMTQRTVNVQMPAGLRAVDPVLTLAGAIAMYQAGVQSTQAYFANPSCPFH